MSKSGWEEKLEALKQHLADYGRLAVAFSGGVDSTFLLAVTHKVLGDNACALTAQSPAFPEREHAEALDFCKQRGIRHLVFDAKQLDIEGFVQNSPERCYFCKRGLFESMMNLAQEHDLGPVADGSNTDDTSDYRPGSRALSELNIVSPLLECGFSKNDIRAASAALGLATAEKPSFACLATRIPYGTPITADALAQLGAAEQALLDLGLTAVRVRINGAEARIEVPPSEMEKAFKLRDDIVRHLKEAGFNYVALDLEGYRTGSMNETL
ncbi:MAG: ATP-dependent sacrificial sulfur transferase LarE [Eggerthellaceae bacterium]|nr:ATP-dependent sacrificial sulfur transferase LarE [Eggerthellaceae bacterium]